MNRTWRRILTAKMLVLSALAPAGIVGERPSGAGAKLDADSSWNPRHPGYPPHVKPGW